MIQASSSTVLVIGRSEVPLMFDYPSIILNHQRGELKGCNLRRYGDSGTLGKHPSAPLQESTVNSRPSDNLFGSSTDELYETGSEVLLTSRWPAVLMEGTTANNSFGI